MKNTAKSKLSTIAMALFALCAFPDPETGWKQTAAGTYVYDDPDNWVGGIVNGVFGSDLTLAGAKPVKFDIKGEDRLGDWGIEIRAAVARLLRRKSRPTAVFCSCDAIARHAMRAFAEAGLSVPRDVSIVGFDDDPIAEWASPALTTVRQNFGAMGREAVKALVARIEKPAAPGVTVKMPVELVERESLVRNSKRP